MPFDVVSYVLAKRAMRRVAQQVVDEHRSKVPIDHPDLSITRAKLEYPTEYVNFAHLAIIDKVAGMPIDGVGGIVVTVDQFSDKAVLALSTQPNDSPLTALRCVDSENLYYTELVPGLSTQDHRILIIKGGSFSLLAYESVDLSRRGQGLAGSVSGSTIKSMRFDTTNPITPYNLPTPTATISATDTSFASGYFGFRFLREVEPHGGISDLAVYLMPPMTRLPPAKAIIEVEIVGRGTEEDPVRPKLAEDVRDGKDYLSVTWGVFDHRTEHSTMLVVITGGNQYTGDRAVEKQVEYVKSKNLKVLRPPRDYREAVEQYKQLRKDFQGWVAGKDNYAYQTLGHEVFELFQVADTYYGNIVEGYKRDAYKGVPDWEMRRTLNMWIDRLKRVNVLTEERDKHVKKLEKVLKVGW